MTNMEKPNGWRNQMEKYEVEVDDTGAIWYYKPGTKLLHRLDGPAVVYTDGGKILVH